ncbi:hypothetical protein [Priestia aryabhattai]|uniref:hypothetical protein n=1 Tax=Priestia aryabhattai TaxID=412384 RepID=UPI003CFBADCB
MEYVMIKLPKCRVYLTHEEVGELLKNDIRLFELGLRRGKGVHRHQIQKQREQEKWRREKGLE